MASDSLQSPPGDENGTLELLPDELILLILSYVENLVDVLSCTVLSKRSRTIIHSSVDMQYKICLLATGKIENPTATELHNLPTHARLELLVDEDRIWDAPRVLNITPLDLPEQMRHTFYFRSGRIAAIDHTEEGPVVQLIDYSTYSSGGLSGGPLSFPQSVSFELDVQQDLLVSVTTSTNPSVIRIHLLSLSDPTRPHSQATTSVLTISPNALPLHVAPAINGDTLILGVFHYNGGGSQTLSIWDWRRGLNLANYEGVRGSFTLLSPNDLFIVTLDFASTIRFERFIIPVSGSLPLELTARVVFDAPAVPTRYQQAVSEWSIHMSPTLTPMTRFIPHPSDLIVHLTISASRSLEGLADRRTPGLFQMHLFIPMRHIEHLSSLDASTSQPIPWSYWDRNPTDAFFSTHILTNQHITRHEGSNQFVFFDYDDSRLGVLDFARYPRRPTLDSLFSTGVLLNETSSLVENASSEIDTDGNTNQQRVKIYTNVPVRVLYVSGIKLPERARLYDRRMDVSTDRIIVKRDARLEILHLK